MQNNTPSLISNIEFVSPEKKIELTLPEQGEARIILKQEIEKFSEQFPEHMILLAIRFVGRRIVQSMPKEKAVQLLSGRRHRIYYAIGKNNKCTIKFAWHKLKYLNDAEKIILKEQINNECFETHNIIHSQKHLIEKTGGCILENLIYRYKNK